MCEQNVEILNMIPKLTSGKGRNELDKLINKIKNFGLTPKNSEIFVIRKPNSSNPEIINLVPDNKMYEKLVVELNEILLNNMIQPQMLTDTKYSIPIYDNDFSYSGTMIKKLNLVHFFLIQK
jgi:hypothetical protein